MMTRDEWRAVRARLRAGPCSTPGCGNSVNKIDLRVRREDGGKFEPANLVARCRGCSAADMRARLGLPQPVRPVGQRKPRRTRPVVTGRPWEGWGDDR